MPSIEVPVDVVRSVQRILGLSDISKPMRFAAIAGGKNNRVYCVDGAPEPLFLKVYYRDAADPRDRFATERRIYELLDGAPSAWTASPLGWDAELGIGLFTHIPGAKIGAEGVDRAAVDGALDFITYLNRQRDVRAAAGLPTASEACFSIAEHLSLVSRRVERLHEIGGSGIDARAAAFVSRRLAPTWARVREWVLSGASHADVDLATTLAPGCRCLSPSDFGFHNAIRRPDGQLSFFDFEYGGWDDPAKLTCDFFCQPQVPVKLEHWDNFVSRLARDLPVDSTYAERARLLLPVYRVKWCCIVLNNFLAGAAARRHFAQPSLASEETKARQLDAAARLCDVVDTGL